jgi:hypothetical protein
MHIRWGVLLPEAVDEARPSQCVMNLEEDVNVEPLR